mgnify:CR=1 FL=1
MGQSVQVGTPLVIDMVQFFTVGVENVHIKAAGTTGDGLADIAHDADYGCDIDDGAFFLSHHHLRSGFDEKRFEPPTIAATEASADLSERDLLLSEKRRLERALNRLKTIYLYGDDEMASKDFNIERERITKALSEVDSRINELDIANAFDLSLSDEAFMQKASQFILTQQLLDKRYVNYERFIRKIDPKIVKDFLNETVSNFCIKDGLTTSILLKNGIELRFSYKIAE